MAENKKTPPMTKVAFAVALVSLLGLAVFLSVFAVFFTKAKAKLQQASAELRAMGDDSIGYDMTINDSIPIGTSIYIQGDVPVNIRLTIDDSMPIFLPLDIDRDLKIPVSLHIDKQIAVDTTLRLPEPLQMDISGSIPLAQPLEIKKWIRLKVFAQGNIPLDSVPLSAQLTKETRFSSVIPIRMQIDDSIHVPIRMHIDVAQKIDVHLPLQTRAIVSFPRKVYISGKIPISLHVSGKIPLSGTPLKGHLSKTADDLDSLF